jgi:hypothetical protein
MAEDAIEWLGDAIDWLGEHAAGLALAAVAGLLLLLVLMGVLMFVTRAKFVRGGLSLPPFRWWPLRLLFSRFTRPRILIAGFMPEGEGSAACAMFAEYLRRSPVRKDAEAKLQATDATDLPQDLIESPQVGRDPLQDVATLFAAFPPAGAVAATVRYVADAAPRWDTRVAGQLLDPASQGPGLRVVITARGRRPEGTRTFWASDLPGPPFSDDEEAATRYALAIAAAAWAHEVING